MSLLEKNIEKWGKIIRGETKDIKVYINVTTSTSSKKSLSLTPQEKEVNEAREIFKQGLIHQDTQPAQTDIRLHVELTEEQKRDLAKAFEQKNVVIDKNSAPYIREKGGEHTIFILKSLPNVVFKIPAHDFSEMAIDLELAMYENACAVIEDQGLNLLAIPKCSKYNLNGIFFLCQERMKINKGYFAQKGLYEFAFEDEDLRPIVEKALLQFVRFICLTGFRDVKYNNFPLLLNGRGIGLFDLDQSKSIGGLVGASNPKEGAFIVAADKEILEKLVEEARATLRNETRQDEFLEIWPANKEKIERCIEKKQQKRQAVKKFLTISQRSFGTEIPLAKKCSIGEKLLIKEINRKLKQSKCLDIVMARRVRLFLYRMWANNNEISRHYRCANDFYIDAEKALNDLQRKGLIERFKIDVHYNIVSLFC